MGGGFRGTLGREKVLEDFDGQGREKKDERQITLVNTWGKSCETCHRPVLAAPIQSHISHQPGWLQIHLRQHRIIPGIFSRHLTLGQGLGQTFLSSRLREGPVLLDFALQKVQRTHSERACSWRGADPSVSLRLFFAPPPTSSSLPRQELPPSRGFTHVLPCPPISVVQVCPSFSRDPASSWKEAHLF